MPQPKVLLVEDSPAIQVFCREVLELEGFAVEAAGSLAEARKKYEEWKPDLAIIDIGLPDGDGLDLLREWNAQPGPVPPMLFLTGRDELQVRLDCFKAGAKDYVLKPCAAQELLARVQVHLSLKRSQDEIRERNNQLELVTRAKQDMTDMIVHDLKAPLSSIKGTLQLITMQGLISERSHASLLQQAGSAADFMLLMLNDLLDVGSAKAGKLKAELGPVDVKVMLSKLVGLFAGRAEALRIKLTPRVGRGAEAMSTDQNLVYRILANLISNAMKFSPPEGEVEIVVSKEKDKALFRVLDRGRGVPEGQKDKIFEKYNTTGRTAEVLETGTGIGLAFCRAATTALDGRIWVEDRDGGGACFTLELPYRPAGAG